jgi:hypothetical protein
MEVMTGFSWLRVWFKTRSCRLLPDYNKGIVKS